MFTADWTSPHEQDWRTALAPLRGRAARLLEIGCWEGRSSAFFLDYLPDAHLTVIDTFDGFTTTNPAPGAEQRFDANTARLAARVEKHVGRSLHVLDRFVQEGRCFDFIYVDGSHRTDDTLIDSVLAWRLLAAGGLAIWDDYLRKRPDQRPGLAFNAFALTRTDLVVTRRSGGQIHARKQPGSFVSRLAAAARALQMRPV